MSKPKVPGQPGSPYMTGLGVAQSTISNRALLCAMWLRGLTTIDALASATACDIGEVEEWVRSELCGGSGIIFNSSEDVLGPETEDEE